VTGTRSRCLALAVMLAVVTAGCGSGSERARSGDRPAVPAPTVPADVSAPTTTGAKAAARWETVTTLSGTGSTRTPAFEILPNAIQWRARYSCESSSLKINTEPPPRRPAALVDVACPREGEGFSIVAGAVSLLVEATGPWKLTIDQQLDTPLNEPPLPAMASAPVVAQGNFYDIEKSGKGSARIYQLPDGGRALRIENLEVNQNTDLFVWLDAAVSPKTSQETLSAEHWQLRSLKSTIGNQNYEIPTSIPIDRVNSVVIWCEPVAIAYAAAALSR
jgi:hypothetical protein